MASHVNAGDSIECNRSLVVARKTTKPTYIILTALNGEDRHLYKYKTNIRTIVKITEELNPRECIICNTSNLLLDDMLEGVTIELYTEKRVKFEVVPNFSHVHGIQGDHVNAFTYAKIVIPWDYVLQRKIAV